MIQYFQTTTLILLWCGGLTFGWALFCYRQAGRRRWQAQAEGRGVTLALVPALVLAPLALVAGFRLFGINLLFPLHFFASPWTLLGAALVPALVLVTASGLLSSLAQSIRQEYGYWQAKTFTLMAMAVGKPVPSSLRRLVLLKALTRAWSQSLPWLFGELIVVEAVFNAPGLGLDAWHRARTRDVVGLLEVAWWLAGLYALCVLLAAGANRWIGKRLASYG